MLIHEDIIGRISQAIKKAQQQDLLPEITAPQVDLEHPQNPVNGDFATSLPLRLARVAQMNPMKIAETLVQFIPAEKSLEKVWAAPPGFINFTLTDGWLQSQVEVINKAGDTYGNINLGNGSHVQVEFVSVNPTGPVHIGHARGAVLGSAIAKVLSCAGYNVVREYYVNDAGSQMDAFYDSLFARYAQALGDPEIQVPLGGYQGQYLVQLGQALANELGDMYQKMPREEAIAHLGQLGLSRMLDAICHDLMQVGVLFDIWFREQDLFQNGEYDTVMDILREQGYTTERDGAVWFTSTSLGDDKDSVIIRSSGQPTYFASDIAYHYNKFVKREFDKVIDVWGADHQGHVSRMKAVVSALGIDHERLSIVIAQLVTLKRDGELTRASKRTGDLVTLNELVEEVGSDACRYFFLARSAESHMEFDLELAVHQTNDNPVYYVQYAHARITGILNLAQDKGIDWSKGNVSLLIHDAELALIRKMLLLPELIHTMVQTLAPHHLPHFATELATAFHRFYDSCRVVSSDPSDRELTMARLRLCKAAQTTLSRTLDLMGIAAPQKM